MFKKTTFLAAIVALIGTFSVMSSDAEAATINGQIDINGTVNLGGASDFSAAGNADLNDPGIVLFSTGDFSGLNLTPVTLTDISFAAPGVIWDVGGFTFTASSFSNIVGGTVGPLFSFNALGTITGVGFDPTPGSLTFTSQQNQPNQVTVSFSSTTSAVPLPAGVLLMGTALAGFGVMRRRRKAA